MQNSNVEIAVPGGVAADCAQRAVLDTQPCSLTEAALMSVVWSDIDPTHDLASRPSGAAHTSPIVLRGPRGSGKTALAKSIVARARRRYGSASSGYMTAADFSRRRRAARTAPALEKLRAQLLSARLWAIDDLDRLPPRDSVQRELMTLIDALAEVGCWLVVATSTDLAASRHLLPALTDRLQAGLIVPLSPGAPSAGGGWENSASELPGTTRDRGPHSDATSPRQIVSIVAKYFAIPLRQLRGPSRQTSTVRARAIAMYLLRTITGYSYSQIGPLVGGRDHTTVMHHCRKIERLVASDASTRQAVDDLQRIILGSA